MQTKRTPLYGEHVKLNARFTEFGGWEMPVFYTSIIEEHNAVRGCAGIFDASHMGEFIVSGDGAAAFLGRITTADAGAVEPGRCKYALMLNENGGIIDDLIIYRRERDFFVVVNAGNLPKDREWINGHLPAGVRADDISDNVCLIALQGPDSLKLLQPLVKNTLGDMGYYRFAAAEFREFKPAFALISRTGYTGEDGFELFVSPESTPAVWEKLLKAGARPCGLGARDTLRLEAGMPLHGHEINDDITPVEAGFGWAVNWAGNFIGKEAITRQKAEGPGRFPVAFMLESGIPRQNFDIILSGKKIGQVASGTFSPTLKKGIGTGFTGSPLDPGSAIEILIHGSPKPAKTVKKPFYKRPR